MATWRDVRRIAAGLPGVSEGTTYGGSRAWTVRGSLLVFERPLRRTDLEALGEAAPTGTILGVRTADLEMKEVLLASDPAVFFTTPHFDGYAAVLIQLAKISSRALKEVMVEAWLARAPKRAVTEFLERKKKVSR